MKKMMEIWHTKPLQVVIKTFSCTGSDNENLPRSVQATYMCPTEKDDGDLAHEAIAGCNQDFFMYRIRQREPAKVRAGYVHVSSTDASGTSYGRHSPKPAQPVSLAPVHYPKAIHLTKR